MAILVKWVNSKSLYGGNSNAHIVAKHRYCRGEKENPQCIDLSIITQPFQQGVYVYQSSQNVPGKVTSHSEKKKYNT